MIDIIIPCYNSHKTIDKTLASILIQTISDKCKVTLVNDGGNSYSDIIKRYPSLNIQELNYSKSKGPGYARNYGLDNTNNPYIIFIDSDDVFMSPFVISSMVKEFRDDIDFLISNIVAVNPDNTTRIIKGNKNFLHGKVYNRSFIDKYNIRFNNSKCCEDSSFNLICFALSNNYKCFNYDFYGWLYNTNSLGRRDPVKWEHCEVPKGSVDNFIYAFNELEKRNCNPEILLKEKIIALLYIIISRSRNNQNFPQFKKENDECLKLFYDKVYKYIKDQVTDEMIDKVYDNFPFSGLKKNNIEIIKQIIKSLE